MGKSNSKARRARTSRTTSSSTSSTWESDMAQSVRYLPVGLFGGVMGIEGFGLVCREAPLPWLKAFAEFWVWLGIAAIVVLTIAYAAKALRHPGAVRDEFLSPVQMGFCATFPLALTLCG